MAEDRVIEEAATQPEASSRKSALRAALNRARQSEADRADVIVDLREAEIARLELLQDALSDMFDEIPEGTDLLEGTLIPGTPPRLWIDVLAHVAMGRDKRTYRFVKESRYGRQVVLETTNLDDMVARVTDYVAHRLLERERALESDMRAPEAAAAAVGAAPSPQPQPATPPRRRGGVLVAFLFGILVGAAGLFGIGLLLTAPQ
jgi:hypothetical protein